MPHQPNPYNNLGEELYHKLWTTKGARFYAHKRLLKKSKLSNQTIGYLTAYVIIINLLGIYHFDKIILSGQFISFATTALSILILVFSQIEASFEYNLRAEKYHDCAKAIGKLYLELRDIMLSQTLSDPEKETEYKKVANVYAGIIERFDNHDFIDFQNFKAEFYIEFKVSTIERALIYFKHYCITFLFYHCLIFSPIIVTTIYLLK